MLYLHPSVCFRHAVGVRYFAHDAVLVAAAGLEPLGSVDVQGATGRLAFNDAQHPFPRPFGMGSFERVEDPGNSISETC